MGVLTLTKTKQYLKCKMNQNHVGWKPVTYLSQMPDGWHVVDSFQGSNGLLCLSLNVQERRICYLEFLFITLHRWNLNRSTDKLLKGNQTQTYGLPLEIQDYWPKNSCSTAISYTCKVKTKKENAKKDVNTRWSINDYVTCRQSKVLAILDLSQYFLKKERDESEQKTTWAQ